MRNRIYSLILAGLVVLWAIPSLAQDPKAAEPEKKAAEKTESTEIDDVEELAFERVTGWYFEGRGGIFFTLAGARGYSNGQPYFGFEFGYDITEQFSMQFSYGSGYQAANPLEYQDVCSAGGGAECGSYHLDFSVTFLNISADYDIWYGERWALEARLGGGAVIIHPSAKPGQSPVDGDVFAGLRFEYYTMLKHFTLGLETDFFYIIPTNIPSLAVTFSILYNF